MNFGISVRSLKTTGVAALAGITGIVAGVYFAMIPQASAQPSGSAADPSNGPRYTVIDTEAWNLIVTDNAANTLYFYTIEEGAEIGSDLKLRGSLDLTQVGEPTLKPKKTN